MRVDEDGGKEFYEQQYLTSLLLDVIPFWLSYGIDPKHGGIFTVLGRRGERIDSDKSIWFQGRAAWMFATLFNTVEKKREWLDASESCLRFLEKHGVSDSGKLYFSVTEKGEPLRMRRYVYSEAFASIAHAAFFRATQEQQSYSRSIEYFQKYVRYSFEHGWIEPKVSSTSRPMIGLASWMICIAMAQEIRDNLGNIQLGERDANGWIDWCIESIERNFVKEDFRAVLEIASPDGGLIDHADGRLLNPGHAIEAAWFILREAEFRKDPSYLSLGTKMLDWMWDRGWDREYGGLYYFRDLKDLPVQEYWHDMKFWWPHCEAIIATLYAWKLTGEARFATWHESVHRWSFQNFSDPEYGEWFGYLHRDGRRSVDSKGSLFKGPFHLPRMLWICSKLCR